MFDTEWLASTHLRRLCVTSNGVLTVQAKRPVVKINATDRGTAVTSLDWSYEK